MDPICTSSGKNIFFQKNKKMRDKCFYCIHFENTFSEFITNLTFIQNLKKMKA